MDTMRGTGRPRQLEGTCKFIKLLDRSSSGGLSDIPWTSAVLRLHGYCIIEWRPVGEPKLPSRALDHVSH